MIRILAPLALLVLGCGPLDRDLIVAPTCPSLVPTTPGNPCRSIPMIPNAEQQKVDGIGDEFCSVPSIAFVVQKMPVVHPNPPPDSPTHGEMHVAWSPGYLHAYAHVVDPSLFTSTSKDLWDGDAIELFIAPPSPTGYDGHYSSSLSRGPIQVIISPPVGATPARASYLLDYPVTGIIVPFPENQYAVRRITDGYTIELRLPWGTVEAPQSGDGVAFDFAVDATDNPAAGHRQLQGLLSETFFDGRELCDFPPGTAAWASCDVRTWCTPTLE